MENSSCDETLIQRQRNYRVCNLVPEKLDQQSVQFLQLVLEIFRHFNVSVHLKRNNCPLAKIEQNFVTAESR